MGTTASTAFTTQAGENSSGGSGLVISPVRTKVLAAKMTVPFLRSDTDAPSQCWTLWSESVPPKMEIPAGESLRYRALANADFSLTEWAMDGPQNAVVQRMVDFFWAVGAPAHQIDLLNDAGVRLNPARLGSWTRLSAAGAMDAGWAFCERVPLDAALAAVGRGEGAQAVAQWAAAHGVAACRELTHDVSGIPPQTTQLRVELPGADAASQLAVAADALARFRMPPLPEAAATLLCGSQQEGAAQPAPAEPLQLVLSLTETTVTAAGLYVPAPSAALVPPLLDFAHGSKDTYERFATGIGSPVPQFVLVTCTAPGAGNTMYKEGFDVLFGWNVGEETLDS